MWTNWTLWAELEAVQLKSTLTVELRMSCWLLYRPLLLVDRSMYMVHRHQINALSPDGRSFAGITRRHLGLMCLRTLLNKACFSWDICSRLNAYATALCLCSSGTLMQCSCSGTPIGYDQLEDYTVPQTDISDELYFLPLAGAQGCLHHCAPTSPAEYFLCATTVSTDDGLCSTVQQCSGI